jgi:hypothetical protein
MRQTNAQREAMDSLRGMVGDLRVMHDAEGWPIVPGRLGQIEYYDGQKLAVFTHRARVHARIFAIPETERHQTGDQELRALFPPTALPEVAKAILARRKRRPSWAQLENLRRSPKHAVHDGP